MDLEAQLQEDLDANFDDLEGVEGPMDEEEDEEDLEPEAIDVRFFFKSSNNSFFIIN